jgi:hypothetical protein
MGHFVFATACAVYTRNLLPCAHCTLAIGYCIAQCTLAIGYRMRSVHRKKKFPVPSRDVTTKLSLGGNNDVITELFLPWGSLVSDIPAGDGKLVNLFLRCTLAIGYRMGPLGS